jgi:hypothetical protein
MSERIPVIVIDDAGDRPGWLTEDEHGTIVVLDAGDEAEAHEKERSEVGD